MYVINERYYLLGHFSAELMCQISEEFWILRLLDLPNDPLIDWLIDSMCDEFMLCLDWSIDWLIDW